MPNTLKENISTERMIELIITHIKNNFRQIKFLIPLSLN